MWNIITYHIMWMNTIAVMLFVESQYNYITRCNLKTHIFLFVFNNVSHRISQFHMFLSSFFFNEIRIISYNILEASLHFIFDYLAKKRQKHTFHDTHLALTKWSFKKTMKGIHKYWLHLKIIKEEKFVWL